MPHALEHGHAHTPGCLCQTPAFARLNAILSFKFTRRAFLGGAGVAGLMAFWPKEAMAGIPAAPPSSIAFTNIRLFDGKAGKLSDGKTVIVSGNKISAVQSSEAPLAPDVQKIDCGGKTLMPGLIDNHWHTMMASLPMQVLMMAEIGFINLAAAAEAERTLLRGFTTVRDMAGPSFGLKRAIDMGMTPGPRIWPSGAMISQTSGHGDFRFPYEIPSSPNAPLSRADAAGVGAIADGVPEVLKRAREQLMLGASQLKLAAGGGVSSPYDPIDVSQYTEPEFRAAADAAEDWGTYVAVHAYTPRAIQTAIRGGVKCIEHGQLMDETTAKMMQEKDIWLSTQAFLDNEFSNPQTGEARQKQLQVAAGTDNAYNFAKSLKLKTAWGTDILFNPAGTANQGALLTTLTRWYEPADILIMATGTNAELLAMSGPRTPYPARVGVIEPDAFADLLIVDGDPLADIKLIADPERNLALIMKDGRIYKNRLQ
ncbi:amidohydrolase family protein [Aestuariivirga sp.]|uniref:metal-dependent hydrolase family protein n=1 Tax=Aestuariivirga sp. TaxID=2650926 RepID=UPI0039E52527